MLTHDHTITTGAPDWVGTAIRCLELRDPREKCALVASLPPDPAALSRPVTLPGAPGRPARPELVDPRQLPRRQLGSRSGHAAFVHAICHIEFTAINLALDAAVRFCGMPPAYYADWIRVAREEAIHYSLLDRHLETLGHAYGDFAAHDGLWDMAQRTADDILLDPEATFAELVSCEFGTLRGAAMNYPAREAAGFSATELDALGGRAG